MFSHVGLIRGVSTAPRISPTSPRRSGQAAEHGAPVRSQQASALVPAQPAVHVLGKLLTLVSVPSSVKWGRYGHFPQRFSLQARVLKQAAHTTAGPVTANYAWSHHLEVWKFPTEFHIANSLKSQRLAAECGWQAALFPRPLACQVLPPSITKREQRRLVSTQDAQTPTGGDSHQGCKPNRQRAVASHL